MAARTTQDCGECRDGRVAACADPRATRTPRAADVVRSGSCKPECTVFTTSRGRRESRRNAFRALHQASEATGLNGDEREPVGPHDLRHSFAAAALERLSLPEASYLLRHAHARVTAQVYAGLTTRRANA